MDQVIENIDIAKDAKEDSLDRLELDLINNVKEIFKSKIKVNCTSCGYCMPCPHGVDIPTNFSIYNNYYVFGDNEEYDGLKDESKASNCVKCGICETHCPQAINIIEEMENIKILFQ